MLINRSNLSEFFFQSISKRSRVNLGYLITTEIGGTVMLKVISRVLHLMTVIFPKPSISVQSSA